MRQTASTGNTEQDLRLLRQLWDDTEHERLRIRQVRDMAGGDQRRYTPGMPDELLQHRANRPRINPGLLGAIFDDLSYLYALDPVRSITREPRWRQILWRRGYGLSAELAAVDRECRVGGGCAVVVQADSSDPPWNAEREIDGISLQTYSMDRVVYLVHPDDLRWPSAVLLQWGTTLSGVPVWQMWTDTIMRWVGGDASQEEHAHGLGCLPVVLLSNTTGAAPTGEPSGGTDLLENVCALNQIVERVGWGTVLKLGQPVVAQRVGEDNKRPPANLVRAPDSAIEVNEAGDFTIVPDPSDLDSMLRVVQAMVDGIAISLGLPPGSVRLVAGEKPGDVQAVVASQIYLQRDRVRRERVARRWEQLVHRTAAEVWAAVSERLPHNIEVTYSRFPAPMTHEEALAVAEFESSHGLADPMALLRMVEPHLSESEAQARLDAAEEHRAKEVERQTLIAGHAEDMEEPEDESSAEMENSVDTVTPMTED